jgi:hypothetical protein
VEKLIESTDISVKEVLPCIKGIFEDETYDNLVKHHSKNTSAYNLVDTVGGYLISKMRRNKINTGIPELNEALKFIQKVYTECTPQVIYDIHGYNIMFRRTSVGVQLVFNDPVA